MQALRDILRQSLRTSLDALTPLDRLATAWPVAAGHAIATHSFIAALDGDVATAEGAGAQWLHHLRELTPQLRGDLQRLSGVPLTDILFVLPSGSPRRNQKLQAGLESH